MKTHSPNHDADPPSASRCILWLPRGYDAPIDLVRGLQQRHVPIHEVHDAPSVMLRLARQRSFGGSVLVLVEPQALRHHQQLVDAARKYHPDVPVWRYRWSDRPVISKWDNGGAPRPADASDEPADESAMHTETLSRLDEVTIDAGTQAADLAPQSHDADDGESLLTDEELAMLLGDDVDDAAGGPR
jgi:hypothetical protein